MWKRISAGLPGTTQQRQERKDDAKVGARAFVSSVAFEFRRRARPWNYADFDSFLASLLTATVYPREERLVTAQEFPGRCSMRQEVRRAGPRAEH